MKDLLHTYNRSFHISGDMHRSPLCVYQEYTYIFLNFIWFFLHLFSYIFYSLWIFYVFLWLYLAHGLSTLLFAFVYLMLCFLITVLSFHTIPFSTLLAVLLIGTALVHCWLWHWFVFIPSFWLSLFNCCQGTDISHVTILFSFDIGFGYWNCQRLCTLPF